MTHFLSFSQAVAQILWVEGISTYVCEKATKNSTDWTHVAAQYWIRLLFTEVSIVSRISGRGLFHHQGSRSKEAPRKKVDITLRIIGLLCPNWPLSCLGHFCFLANISLQSFGKMHNIWTCCGLLHNKCPVISNQRLNLVKHSVGWVLCFKTLSQQDRSGIFIWSAKGAQPSLCLIHRAVFLSKHEGFDENCYG